MAPLPVFRHRPNVDFDRELPVGIESLAKPFEIGLFHAFPDFGDGPEFFENRVERRRYLRLFLRGNRKILRQRTLVESFLKDVGDEVPADMAGKQNEESLGSRISMRKSGRNRKESGPRHCKVERVRPQRVQRLSWVVSPSHPTGREFLSPLLQ